MRRLGSSGGVKGDSFGLNSYVSLASLPATGANNVSYKVTNDPTATNNGYYHWNGSSYVKDAELVSSVVNPTNTSDGLSGKAVSDFALSKDSFFSHAQNIKNNFQTYYNGIGAKSVLQTNLTLSAAGDYIEFSVTLTELGAGTAETASGMGMAGEVGLFNSNIGVWGSGKLYIRSSAGTWLTLDGFLNLVSENNSFTIKLLWNGSDIGVYKNGVFQKNITNGTLIINNIGSGYNDGTTAPSFKGYIGGLTIKSGATTYEYGNPHTQKTFINTSTSLFVKEPGFLSTPQKTILDNVSLSPCFYSLDANGSSTGHERFMVYQKINGASYAGFLLDRELNVGIRSDLWRIREAKLYDYSDGNMVQVLDKLLVDGENECVYKTVGATDFTGGTHGDEQKISSNFYANGVKIDSIATDISLTPCDSFYYSQKSNMLRTDVGSDTYEAIHDKITKFENKGYNTFNRLSWLMTSNIERWYHGISCIGKISASNGNNEFLTFAVFNNDQTNKLTKMGAREFYSENSTNKISSFVTSKLIKPVNSDSNCYMFVWDRLTDSKYYREFLPSSNPVNGEIWESYMEVKFNKL